MFIDRAVVRVVAGTGGSGASSFARFKYKPKGGPDGGDGGHGGSVYVRGDPNLATLLDYRYRNVWKAERGEHGKGKTQTGASSDDVYLPVPPGTVVRDADTGDLLGEVLRPGERIRVAKGGRGGRGNARFATPTHQAPREWEPGEAGEERSIELVLKLIADVGLVGEPNAGKSTLLSVLSAARPKIADYPFTTLEPNLGVVGLSGHRSFVVADIPGIIEGAHQGKGLGLRFLQHVERTRVLAYLVPLDAADPQAAYAGLRHEVRQYSAALAAKPHVVLLTKRDLLPAGDPIPRLDAPEVGGILTVSSAAGTGLEELKEYLWKLVAAAKVEEAPVEAWGEGPE
jgi:GTP-binding protein